MKPPIRAVTDDERAPKPQTVAEAAASGDHRALLVSMRERIAKTVSNPDCPPRDLASLTRRLQDVAKEIELIDIRAREDGADANETAADETWTAESI